MKNVYQTIGELEDYGDHIKVVVVDGQANAYEIIDITQTTILGEPVVALEIAEVPIQ